MFGFYGFLVLLIVDICAAFNSFNVKFDNRKPLKLSFLGSSNGHGKLFAGAFFIALDHVNKNSTLLEGYRLDYLFNDTSGNSLNAINAMTYHHGINTVGFIGPDISCHCESNIAAAWNLPMIGYVRFSILCLQVNYTNIFSTRFCNNIHI